MKVKRKITKLVKPIYQNGAASHSTHPTIPLSVFDTVTYNMHVAVVSAYRPPAPPSSRIQEGLAIVLSHYPEWAGRLDMHAIIDGRRHPALVLNDAGVTLVEASVDEPLDRSLLLQPTQALLDLHPTAHGGVEELLQVQLTRFSCGSLVVGFTAHHYVADAHSSGTFLVAWGKATRGLGVDPRLPPHCRATFFRPRHPLMVEYEHRGVEYLVKKSKDQSSAASDDDDDDDCHHRKYHYHPPEEEIVVHKFHFSRDFLTKLKAKASATTAGKPYSTFVSLQAHLWRVITAARGLDEDDTTQIRISVNGRQRLRPRVPDGYFGNLVLWAFPRTKVRDLLASPLHHAAKLVHEAVAVVGDRYFRSFVDFAAGSGAVEEEGLATSALVETKVLCPDMEVDSWLRFPFHEMDFGGGGPFACIPSYIPMEGVVCLLASFSGDGGVDAYAPLFRRDLRAFKDSCYLLV